MRQIAVKIKFSVLCLIAFCLACYIYITPPFIFLFVFVWLIEGDFKRKINAFMTNKYAMLFSGFYLLHFIGMIFTHNSQTGWFDLQVKASLIVFPLLFVSGGETGPAKQKQFMWAFVAGCICNGLICLGYAMWKYYFTGVSEFLYSQMSLFLHPSYYAMYIDIALVMIFYMIVSPTISLKKLEKVIAYISVFFLIFMLVILESKTGMIVSALIFSAVSLRYLFHKEHRLKAVVLLAGTIIIYALTYNYMITSLKSRIGNAGKTLNSGQLDKASPESTQVRYYVWQAAWEIVKEHPLIGMGTGDADSALQLQYAKDNYTGALVHHLNAHNEYLQVAVELGFVGLFGLLACLALPFFKSIKEHRYVYMAFLIIISINFLTESMLEQQAGTIFYGLFNSLLMFNFVI